MTEQTTHLALPYIMPSQAQKHVTHNEALQRLDATVQMVVQSETATPPEDAQEGDCHLIAAAASGEWAGKAGLLAFQQDDAWLYIAPRHGWRAWFAADNRLKVFHLGAWQIPPLPENAGFQQLGVGTTADAYNKLAIAAPASLFTHDASGSHQVKLNKAAASDTASVLFQSGWSGRAEMGLAGNDAFSIKTSADGTDWQVALAISGRGVVTTPARPIVRAGRTSANVSPANGAVSGFTYLAAQQGGFALGDIVSGNMQELRVPATGLYMLLLSLSVVSSSGHGVAIRINGTTSTFTLNGTASSANTLQTASFIMALQENDRLTLSHTGTCQLAFGAGKTELSLMML